MGVILLLAAEEEDILVVQVVQGIGLRILPNEEEEVALVF